MQIEKGMIVKSIAGRDQCRFYLVLDADEQFAFIADGKVRLIDKPKKKKAKHLAKTDATADVAMISTNRQLRRALAAYNGAREETNIE